MHIPHKFNTYFEPFVGGGAVLFDIQPKKAIVNDVNLELIATYKVIRDAVDELIEDLSKHKNEKDYFYTLRELDRMPEYKTWPSVKRASRLIYLNKTCYNGLFRVNHQGQFNVPFGNYKNPNIINEIVLRAVHHYLTTNDVLFHNTDFTEAVVDAKRGDFVYLDPPYDPMSDTADFTGYSLNRFGRDEQIRLKRLVEDLDQRGCKVLLSNSSTEFIRDLYKDYEIVTVKANRAINSDASKRGKIDEVLIMNYHNLV